jgi:hypothetical protein|tara:strand:+ start:412 stop:1356 length:945 start_codon:yes stop_codon:yes gene_type:complete
MNINTIDPVILTDDHKVEFDGKGCWGNQFLMIDIPKSDISKKTIDVFNEDVLGNDLSVWSLLLSDNGFGNNSNDTKWRLVDGNWRTYIEFYDSPFIRINKLSNNELFQNLTLKIYYDTRIKLGYERIRNGKSIERYFVSKLKPELFDILKIQLEDWEYIWNSYHEGKPLQDKYPEFEGRIGHINLFRKYHWENPKPRDGYSLRKEYDNELYVLLSTTNLNYFSQLSEGKDRNDIVTDQFSFDDLYESFDILKYLNINYRVDYQIKKNKEWGKSDKDYLVDNPKHYYYGCVRDWLVPGSKEEPIERTSHLDYQYV